MIDHGWVQITLTASQQSRLEIRSGHGGGDGAERAHQDLGASTVRPCFHEGHNFKKRVTGRRR